MSIKLLFSEYFEIDGDVLDAYGALNICIDADLPLFIDPFLLFSSEKEEYVLLHDQIVNHLIKLKELAAGGGSPDIRLFRFPEVKQNWLGLCKWGNNGRGLGAMFARNLIGAFNGFYSNFGSETISSASHIEKLTLVGAGIGRDFISDFTANIILEYLLNYTQEFALNHLREDQRKEFSVRCKFDDQLMAWMPKSFILPYFYFDDGDYILLTPLDILTKDDAFICHSDLRDQFRKITNALENSELRDSINLYFQKMMPPQDARQQDIERAISATIQKYPEILDYYIRYKEHTKDSASIISIEKVEKVKRELISTLSEFCNKMADCSDFYALQPSSYEAALQRAIYLKEVIEDNDGYRIFYKGGKAIASEDTIQRIFRLTWFATSFDVNSEVNNGRGPADYKISYGERDSTIVEFKLASSSSLKRNLLNQTEIYKKASKSINDIKVILCYTEAEIRKVKKILTGIGQVGAENIVIIDGTKKLSASRV